MVIISEVLFQNSFSFVLAMESCTIHVDKEALKQTSEMLGVRVCDSLKE